MRSLAIIPVVAFHAGATMIPGGFIGVDVFYVISGFLITTILLREAEKTGRIALGLFWAKRIRRLVPALVVTVVFTLVVGALLGSVLGWDSLALQGAASVSYVANILFWRESTNYFDTGSGLSPFLHMWSLGVEEQFYVLWPLILIAGIWIAARRFTLRSVLAVAFSLVFVCSLGLSVFLTPVSPNAAFYLLPTRAWEFAGAGLLALLPAAAAIRSRAVATAAGVAGVVILVAGFVFLSEADAYPGHLALVPFVGTILLIVAGGGARSALAPVLESRPAVWIGNVSYSWYLWHWPLIVFAKELFPESATAMAAAALLSLGVAALSYTYIEQPLRFRPFLAASVRRTYVVGLTATAATVVVALGVFATGSAILRTEPMRTYAKAAETLPARDCADGVSESFGAVDACILGDPTGEKTIAVIGDSHAGHWRGAVEAVAQRAGYRLVFRWLSSCPSMDVPVTDLQGVTDPKCEPYREQTNKIVEAVRPDLVIISNANAYDGRIRGADGERLALGDQQERWREALGQQIEWARGLGAQVGIVRDNPRMLFNPTACLSTLHGSQAACESDMDSAHQLIRTFDEATQEAIADESVVSVFSTDDAICGGDVCRAVDDSGVPIYQDQSHLSEMWTMTQVPRLEQFVIAIERGEAVPAG
jgi:peptidoglycan/LPS O-acetylase OafA/YrhL